jgi:hypothetical protein
VLAELVNGADVGMVKRGSGSRFAFKARYPRRATVSMYFGCSAESLNACRSLLIAE